MPSKLSVTGEIIIIMVIMQRYVFDFWVTAKLSSGSGPGRLIATGQWALLEISPRLSVAITDAF